jgi:hypothetical protein
MSDNPAEDEDENREPVFINNNFDIPPLPPSPVHIDQDLINRLYVHPDFYTILYTIFRSRNSMYTMTTIVQLLFKELLVKNIIH